MSDFEISPSDLAEYWPGLTEDERQELVAELLAAQRYGDLVAVRGRVSDIYGEYLDFVSRLPAAQEAAYYRSGGIWEYWLPDSYLIEIEECGAIAPQFLKPEGDYYNS